MSFCCQKAFWRGCGCVEEALNGLEARRARLGAISNYCSEKCIRQLVS